MFHESKFDIITLSKTWLNDEKYVQITKFKFSHGSRDQKRG